MQNESGSKRLALEQQYILVNHHQDQAGLDILSLCINLYKRRWFIMGFTSMICIFAIIISFMIKPQYEVQTILMPPNEVQLKELYLNTDYTKSSQELFVEFLKELSKKSNYIQFIQNSKVFKDEAKGKSEKIKRMLLASLAKNYNLKFFKHSQNDTKDTFRDDSLDAELITRSNTLDLEAKENLAYLAFTNQKIINKIVASERSNTEVKAHKLEELLNRNEAVLSGQRKYTIKRLREKQSQQIAEINNQIAAAKSRDLRDKQLQLIELTDAYNISEALGITNHNSPQQVTNHGLVIDVNQNQHELYLRGTNFLKKAIEIQKSQQHSLGYERNLSGLQEKLFVLQNNKEIEALEHRKDDKPYVKNIVENEVELERLKSLSFDIKQIKAYDIDGKPIVGPYPVKPKKSLILICAFIFGLFLSISIIYLQNALRARKDFTLNENLMPSLGN